MQRTINKNRKCVQETNVAKTMCPNSIVSNLAIIIKKVLKSFLVRVGRAIALAKALIKYSFYNEFAYWANNWGSVVSTVFYTISTLFFLQMLIGKYTYIVGLNKDELLLVFLFNQLAFYLFAMFDEISVIEDIRTGKFDYYLIRPWSIFSAVIGNNINVFYVIRDAIIPLGLVISAIDFGSLYITPLSIALAIFLFLAGLIIATLIRLSSIAISFFVGEGKALAKLIFSMSNWHLEAQFLPIEKVRPLWLVMLVLFGIIPARFTALALDNRLENLKTVLVSTIIVLIISIIATMLLWKKGLKHYSSASS